MRSNVEPPWGRRDHVAVYVATWLPIGGRNPFEERLPRVDADTVAKVMVHGAVRELHCFVDCSLKSLANDLPIEASQTMHFDEPSLEISGRRYLGRGTGMTVRSTKVVRTR